MSAPLHPPNLVTWVRTVECGVLVCDHCGLPAPCLDETLEHMRGPDHHAFCLASGYCYHARRPLSELPQL